MLFYHDSGQFNYQLPPDGINWYTALVSYSIRSSIGTFQPRAVLYALMTSKPRTTPSGNNVRYFLPKKNWHTFCTPQLYMP